MTDDSLVLDQLNNLIWAYFNQDMEETIPEAIAEYARTTRPIDRADILREMDDFTKRYHDDLEGEFRRRWGTDFELNYSEQTVREFFDMVRGIVADPDRASWYEDETNRRLNEKYFPKLTEIVAGGKEPSPLAIADTVGAFTQSDRDQLLRELDDFEKRFPGLVDVALAGRFKCSNGQHFLDMIRAIMNDPNCYKQYENPGNMRPRDD